MRQELKGEAAWIYRKVLSHPLIAAFLQQQEPDEMPVRVGWGYRPSGRAAVQAARRDGSRLLLLEDSFVRSIQTGAGATVYGIIADSQGIHYDPEGKSDLLVALESGKAVGWMRESPEIREAEMLMARFREIGASKYNCKESSSSINRAGMPRSATVA